MSEANLNDCLVIGQRVHWTDTGRRRGNSFEFVRREGKVVSYNDGDPMVVVRFRGIDRCILRTKIRAMWQKSELTELAEDMAR